MKINYEGKRMGPREELPEVQVFRVEPNGRKEVTPQKSLALRGHSPTGFEWGYGGSGPAQLALAILLDFTGKPKTALEHYMDFKWAFVGGWGDEWSITGSVIAKWLRTHRAASLEHLSKLDADRQAGETAPAEEV
jgi:hypothetical protein